MGRKAKLPVTLNAMQKLFAYHYVRTRNTKEAAKFANIKIEDGEKWIQQLEVQNLILDAEEKMAEECLIAVGLSFEAKIRMLKEGIEHYTETGQYLYAAKLIEIANVMQGHEAPSRLMSITKDLNPKTDKNDPHDIDVGKRLEEIKKEYEKEY